MYRDQFGEFVGGYWGLKGLQRSDMQCLYIPRTMNQCPCIGGMSIAAVQL